MISLPRRSRFFLDFLALLSGRSLVNLCWMTVPVCLSAPYIAILTATNRQTRITQSVILAGIIAVAANVLLAATASGRGIVENLSIVAAIKALSMVALLVFYRAAYRR